MSWFLSKKNTCLKAKLFEMGCCCCGKEKEPEILVKESGKELTSESFSKALKLVASKFSGNDIRRNLYASALKQGRDYFLNTKDFERENTKFVITDKNGIVLEIVPNPWSSISRKIVVFNLNKSICEFTSLWKTIKRILKIVALIVIGVGNIILAINSGDPVALVVAGGSVMKAITQ